MKHRFLFALALAVLAPAAKAQDVAAFYKGKTINLIISTSPGGDYDVRARLVGRHIGRHIPGSPTVLPQNMPGRGGIRAANYLYNGAARDGTAMLAVMQQIPLTQVFKLSGVEFDLARGHYIGNTSSSPIVVASWHTSPVKTVEQSIASELIIGASGAGSASTQIPAMLNATIGTKFKVIAGYGAANKVVLAMLSGETQGSFGTWNNVSTNHAQALRDGDIRPLLQIALTADPTMPNVPLLLDMAEGEEAKQLVRIMSSSTLMGQSFAGPPALPEPILTALRRAFDATMVDKEFVEKMNNIGVKFTPMTGEDLTKQVDQIMNTSPELVERYKAISGEGGAAP